MATGKQCDRCGGFAITRDTHEWYRINRGRNAEGSDPKEQYDFCSLKCVAVWAARHRKKLFEEGIEDQPLSQNEERLAEEAEV